MVAEAQADAVRAVAQALSADGGQSAANLKVAEHFVDAFSQLAKQGNTLIIPSNVADPAGFIATAMTVLDRVRPGLQARPANT